MQESPRTKQNWRFCEKLISLKTILKNLIKTYSNTVFSQKLAESSFVYNFLEDIFGCVENNQQQVRFYPSKFLYWIAAYSFCLWVSWEVSSLSKASLVYISGCYEVWFLDLTLNVQIKHIRKIETKSS